MAYEDVGGLRLQGQGGSAGSRPCAVDSKGHYLTLAATSVPPFQLVVDEDQRYNGS